MIRQRSVDHKQRHVHVSHAHKSSASVFTFCPKSTNANLLPEIKIVQHGLHHFSFIHTHTAPASLCDISFCFCFYLWSWRTAAFRCISKSQNCKEQFSSGTFHLIMLLLIDNSRGKNKTVQTINDFFFLQMLFAANEAAAVSVAFAWITHTITARFILLYLRCLSPQRIAACLCVCVCVLSQANNEQTLTHNGVSDSHGQGSLKLKRHSSNGARKDTPLNTLREMHSRCVCVVRG